MKKTLNEFKKFAMRGNVVDMAVGIIIGGALKWVIKRAVMEGDKVISPEVAISYGNFIQVVFDFLIIALAVFFLVKGINALTRKKEAEAKTPPAPPADIQLLTEIRDLLKEKKESE